MSGRTGFDALRHIPGAESRRIGGLMARTRLLVATPRAALARLARTLGLECLVDLLGRRLTADCWEEKKTHRRLTQMDTDRKTKTCAQHNISVHPRSSAVSLDWHS
jgi:hypothetical protein